MDDVLKAIQQKYGVSRADSKKIVDALVVIEKDKQLKPRTRRKSAKSDGLLDDLTGGLLGDQQGGGEIQNLIGGILGGQQGDLGNVLGGILGGQQGRSDLFGIVSDLVGSHAGQVAGLAGIVGALLVGQGNTDVMDTVNGMLGRSTPEKPAERPQTSPPTQSASDRLRKLGAAAKNQPLDVGSDGLDVGKKK